MRRLLAILALGLTTLVGSLPAGANHFQQSDAVWQVKCPHVGHNFHDAIASPGQPNVSHRHEYFNIRSSYDETVESLTSKPGTCTFGSKSSLGLEPLDHASYWVPGIKYNGAWVDMSQVAIDAYYYLGNNHPPVQPFPLGLKIIAGNGQADAPQSSQVIRMRCVSNNGNQGPNLQTIPDCRNEPLLDTVVIVILFPECWDGVNLDSADHKSHMAYAGSTGCPASHPVDVPKLSMTIRYLGPWKGGPGSVFAGSGNPYSAHADFFNAWDPERQQELVDTCLNAVFNCRFAQV